MTSFFDIRHGFEETDRETVAKLFWEAFSAKLTRIMGPDVKGVGFFSRVLDPGFALSAYGDDGTLLGVAGFKTSKGAMTDGEFSDLTAVYGTFGTLWRLPFLLMLERKVESDVLLMDGIFVAEHARSQGVGKALLEAVGDEALARGCSSVRLDVIDTNPRARELYERIGFKPLERHSLGPLKWLFGFSYATTMTRRV